MDKGNALLDEDHKWGIFKQQAYKEVERQVRMQEAWLSRSKQNSSILFVTFRWFYDAISCIK